MTQNELLDHLETDLRRLLDQVRTQIVPLEEAAVQYRPDPSRWNVLECFAHLNAFAELYLPRIEAGIHKAKARKWTPADALQYTAAARRDIRRVNLANEKPRKSKKIYNFYHRPLGTEVIKTFIINCERLLRNLHLAHETDLNRPKIARGHSGFFHYTLGNTFEWLIRHAQRHLAQAQTLLNQMQGKGLL
ncbi:MAG: DinB family protein [Saprospiraceae bacterium]